MATGAWTADGSCLSARARLTTDTTLRAASQIFRATEGFVGLSVATNVVRLGDFHLGQEVVLDFFDGDLLGFVHSARGLLESVRGPRFSYLVVG